MSDEIEFFPEESQWGIPSRKAAKFDVDINKMSDREFMRNISRANLRKFRGKQITFSE
jgi:hypothetical protein